MEWTSEARIKVTPPKRPKKITGSRFAAVLGLDKWNTPFKTWCAITRIYDEPFVDTKYTIAGKAIEPKVLEYLNKVYFFGGLKTPTDIYGKDYFSKTYGDFFKDSSVFGGMWDALYYDDGKLIAVIEVKTTKRVEAWANGAPEGAALQAALYAHLLGVDQVVMAASFLEETDYDQPEKFIPSSNNTVVDMFCVSERFPRFQAHLDRAKDWWDKHVVTGLSPVFDEKADADTLKALRKNTVSAEHADLSVLLVEAEALKLYIERVVESIADKEKRLKVVNDTIKQTLIAQFRNGDKKVAVTGSAYEWVVSRADSTEIDKDALKADGLLEKYTKTKIGYRITQLPIKKEG